MCMEVKAVNMTSTQYVSMGARPGIVGVGPLMGDLWGFRFLAETKAHGEALISAIGQFSNAISCSMAEPDYSADEV